MRRLQLRSRSGCSRCRERRRKCDERRPICGECLRLGFKCHWQVSISRTGKDRKLVDNDVDWVSTGKDRQYEAQVCSEIITGISYGFDHPSILRASATSMIKGPGEKHALQYLFEQGHHILRYPVQRVPIAINVNTFRRGYPMAITAPKPIQVQALICVGAAYLSKVYHRYESMALQQYNSTLSAFGIVLNSQQKDFPAEWMCAVASILSYYQVTF